MLIKNGLVLTLDPERRVIADGAVAVEDDRIVAVGKTRDLEGEHGSDEVVDAARKIVMPGLVNAHNHMYQMLVRGLRDDGYAPKGQKYVWDHNLRQNIGKKECYSSGMLSAVEMLRSGITCTQDSHYINFHRDSLDGVAESVLDSGIRVVLGRGCWDIPGLAPDDSTEDVKTVVRESSRVISRWHGKGDGRILVRVESSTLAQCTDEMIQATKEVASKNGLGWAIHIQAQIGHYPYDLRTDDPAMKKYGGRGIELLQDLGILGPDSLLIHCNTSTLREAAILARTHTPVAHCPVSNAWYGEPSHTAVPYMLERGVTVGLGTDGALTNDSQDLFQAMKICALLHKVNYGDIRTMPAEKVIEMSTIDSAKALRLDSEIGSLEVGKKADIILLDLHTPGLTPNLLTVKNIVYSAANGNAVDTVIIDGKTIMEERVIKSFDEENAYRDGEAAAHRMVEMSGHTRRDPLYLKPAPWKYL